MNIQRISSEQRLLRAATALDRAEFVRLLAAFDTAWQQATRGPAVLTMRGTVRQRAYGAGGRGALPTAADKLLFILFYFTHHPTQHVVGLFFDCSQQQASEWLGRLAPVLNRVQGFEKQRPNRHPADLESVLRAEPLLRELLVDGVGTAEPIRKGRRPAQGKPRRLLADRASCVA